MLSAAANPTMVRAEGASAKEPTRCSKSSPTWHDRRGLVPFFLDPLFFIGLWVTVIVFMRRRWAGFGTAAASRCSPSATPGEIDEGEYRQRRNVLATLGRLTLEIWAAMQRSGRVAAPRSWTRSATPCRRR